jgi:hypothetical protein
MSENPLAKIAITSTADSTLGNALNQINQNFEGGRVTKADLASWLIQRASSTLSENTIEEIQRTHFNQVTYLENLLKKMKSSDRDSLSPAEMDTVQQMLGMPHVKRRPKTGKPAETAPDNSWA